MNGTPTYNIDIITDEKALPDMASDDLFHSRGLFHVLSVTPRHKPYMVVAGDASGRIAGHLLVSVRSRGSLLPPYWYSQARIYGTGEYAEGVDEEEVFSSMLSALTQRLGKGRCLYIEVSDLKQKMFAYSHFKQCGYFPVRWQEVHNSLHSKAPEERLGEKTARLIREAYDMGVETREVENEEELHAFYKMLHGFYRLKLRRFIPPEKQFIELNQEEYCRIFITKYKGKVIGGSCCVFSENNAYLWYLASKRKSYRHQHPNTVTVWHAIRFAYDHGYDHIRFMDVGLPFKKNPFRDFILSFGGKPVGNYRWFRFSPRILNRLLQWIYKE